VLTAVVTKNSIFWKITLRSPVRARRHFGEICHLHFQDRKERRRKRKEKWEDEKEGTRNLQQLELWFTLHLCGDS
jgi:hypothetical protein